MDNHEKSSGREKRLPTPLRRLGGATFLQAALGSLLLFAALPPWSLWPLGWVAPIPWLLLVRRNELLGKRPYLQIYLAGVLFWLAALHWLRLPHPATSVGWIAVALYMGCYLPALVALSRVAVHTLKAPLWIAAPIVWTGLEYVRAHLLTGFLMASVAHTQIRWPAVLQIADLAGEYAVDFVIVLVAACIAESLVIRHWPFVIRLLPAAIVLAATLTYGYWRVGQDVYAPGPRVALIQGNALAEWKADPNRAAEIMREYTRLSVDAVRAAKTTRRSVGNVGLNPRYPADLVVWPETMFRGTIVTFRPDQPAVGAHEPPPDQPDVNLREYEAAGPAQVASLVKLLDTPVLLGVDVIEFLANSPDQPAVGAQRRNYRAWNSAVLAVPADEAAGNVGLNPRYDAKIVGRYDKVHLVIFGEYIPFADYIPWLYSLTPLAGGVTPGEGPVALSAGSVGLNPRSEGSSVVYAPNICYESVLPHVIRRQVVELTAQGTPPDVLVNLTNDAWYWGSSELDMHLACGVLRAIETRTPHLIAANGGLSAHVDSCGRIVEQSPRQQPDYILADVQLDPRTSLYTRIGDWPAGVCLGLCGVCAVVGWVRRNETEITTRSLSARESR